MEPAAHQETAHPSVYSLESVNVDIMVEYSGLQWDHLMRQTLKLSFEATVQ